MSKIRLSFFAQGPVLAGGTLVLDTSTEKFSGVKVFCADHPITAPTVWYSLFAKPGLDTGSTVHYPDGTPLVLNIGEENGTTVQINYRDHDFTSEPIPIHGGFVSGVPFDIINAVGGDGETGWVAIFENHSSVARRRRTQFYPKASIGGQCSPLRAPAKEVPRLRSGFRLRARTSLAPANRLKFKSPRSMRISHRDARNLRTHSRLQRTSARRSETSRDITEREIFVNSAVPASQRKEEEGSDKADPGQVSSNSQEDAWLNDVGPVSQSAEGSDDQSGPSRLIAPPSP